MSEEHGEHELVEELPAEELDELAGDEGSVELPAAEELDELPPAPAELPATTDDVEPVDEAAHPYVDEEPPADVDEPAPALDPAAPAFAMPAPLTPAERVHRALAFMRRQHDSGSDDWPALCEKLNRSAYGLPAHFASAELHAHAVPARYRHGHEEPSRGDLLLIRNGRFGHIATFDPTPRHPWAAWSNDFGGRGRVTLVADARKLVAWCGGHEWFVADAWWPAGVVRTHHAAPATPPAPAHDGRVKLSNLRAGARNADVIDLRRALVAHGYKLGTMSSTYDRAVDHAVRLDQRRHDGAADPAGRSFVGPRQAARLGLHVV